ncbi:Ig-like domain-containing protein [Oceanicoccus sp. KOV_DT_Chl]|uniref:Ig-like domain-containing protein n=1 Tax=Oceanicoccus sp. KOV_DT_Chl TaxID=1904639 RepID=UPI00135C1EEA|nr:Ig-like domain-containing protein [Oceanicoccus sp. KOV_DT_Chl]
MASGDKDLQRGFGYKNGYGHHDAHSGRHNNEKGHTRWSGPHKGCNTKGKHHHRDRSDSSLNCLNAYASPSVLWPANHKFKTVSIKGLSTASGVEPVVIIQCVSQDEPVNGQGDSNTAYDAKWLSDNRISLRKERAGGGNGRVYHIDFFAHDEAAGESCSGSVAVEVPHHKHGKAQDEGKLYPSLEGGVACREGNNSSPEITSTAITSATESVAYQYVVSVSDADDDVLGYLLETAPAGMTISSEGEIAWTPGTADIGSHSIMVTVDDGRGGSAEQLFTLIVSPRPNNAPVITSTPVLSGIEGQAYQYQIEVSDAEGDALVYNVVLAPENMSVSSNGLVQWSPAVGSTGSYDIILQVSDGQIVVEQTYTLAISPKPNTAPSITTVPLTNASEGSHYQYILTASDPDGDTLIFSLVTAPVSMTVIGDTISWIPTYSDAGEHSVLIAVSDSQGGTASQGFTVIVADTNRDPEITSIPVVEIAEGQAYQYLLEANDADGDPLNFVLVDGPAGLSIDGEGLISWVPGYDDEGQYHVAINVLDGKGGSSNHAFTLNVSSTNRDPQISSVPVLIAKENVLYQYQLAASDDDGDVLSYRLAIAPSSMIISTEGLISWVPDINSAGEQAIEVVVTDGDVNISQRFLIAISNTNQAPIAVPDSVSVLEGGAENFLLQATDSDGDALIFTLLTEPEYGTLLGSPPDLIYVPNSNYHGTDSLTFYVSDAEFYSEIATVNFTVNESNQAPIITSIPFTTTVISGETFTYDVEAFDADGDELVYF